jgi:hypothetical protein
MLSVRRLGTRIVKEPPPSLLVLELDAAASPALLAAAVSVLPALLMPAVLLPLLFLAPALLLLLWARSCVVETPLILFSGLDLALLL